MEACLDSAMFSNISEEAACLSSLFIHPTHPTLAPLCQTWISREDIRQQAQCLPSSLDYGIKLHESRRRCDSRRMFFLAS